MCAVMHMFVDVCVAKLCCYLGERRLSALSCYVNGHSLQISDLVNTLLAPQTTISIERSGESRSKGDGERNSGWKKGDERERMR